MLRIRAFPLSNSSYVSQVYAGLADLAAESRIELEFTWNPAIRIREVNGRHVERANRHVAYLEITAESGQVYTACYDLSDGPHIVSLGGLEQCDAYFKRSFLPEVARRLYHKEKIRPFGLNYPVGSNNDADILKKYFIHQFVTGQWHRQPIRSARELVRTARARFRPGKCRASDYRFPTETLEHEPDKPAEPLILFQTRLFDPTMATDPRLVIELNEFRVATLRALHGAFGERFVGGLIPNEYTKREYPQAMNLIAPKATKRGLYLDQMKRCLISVFTRGLVNSNGWRLPEFLAASRCIVSQALVYELPVPLQQDVNCMFFETPEQCVDSCRRLLEDGDFAATMRRRNFDYYQEQVKPASIVWNSIRTTLEIAEKNRGRTDVAISA